ncbi:hypothetical protein GCU60_00495 [Blastococcus saxobsidens]|uniref:Uncharacterized protein n=1 Tax=Blastococcus saxobsidens TaxID=138336 RepID=A0A6L9VWV0_9ACTN|nr:hypothetical protein [Blastococcus saxobsidens]NEK84255.1 hypothetical protein [Blastococcus saxobsidens]
MIENSGFPVGELLSHLPARFARDVEVISYFEERSASGLGKGVGEALMLDRLDSYVTECGHAYELVVKVTGRLIVRNAGLLLPHTVSSQDAFVRLRRDLTQVDSRLFAVTPAILHEHLTGLAGQVDERNGRYLEHAVAERVLTGVGTGLNRRTFSVAPVFTGASGSTGAAYAGPRRLVEGLTETFRNRLPGDFL